jgi:ATP-dependent Clp protease ATP-binding subunit ClpA
MFEPYTERAWRAIFFARYEAGQYGSSHVASEHVLLGLLSQDKALLEMFAGQENLFRQIRAEIEQHCGPYKWLSEFRAEIEQHGSSYGTGSPLLCAESQTRSRREKSSLLTTTAFSSRPQKTRRP